MPTNLEKSIFKTLCWFSVTAYPITGFEIWKWLLEPERSYDLSEVYRVLKTSEWLQERIKTERGHYTLNCLSTDVSAATKKDLIDGRQERYLDAMRKFRKLHRASFYFRMFASVRAVMAVNTIAWWNTSPVSDIDLFIVTKPNAVWSTRFWVVLPFLLLGIRPRLQIKSTEETVVGHDPFCFSFFVSRTALSMNHLRLPCGDHYFAFWIKSILPIFDRDQICDVINRENSWAHAILPNATSRQIPLSLRGGISNDGFFIPTLFRHTGFFERIYQSIQQTRFPESIRMRANLDSSVVVNDEMLKFHEQDRRAEFQKLYEERILE